MQSTEDYHNRAKFIAKSIDGIQWIPAVLITSLPEPDFYAPIKSAPTFKKPEYAIKWARENW